MGVPMVAAEVVRQMGQSAEMGWGAKRISRELGVARNTVRRYLRGSRAEVTSTRCRGGSTWPPEPRRCASTTALPRAMRSWCGCCWSSPTAGDPSPPEKNSSLREPRALAGVSLPADRVREPGVAAGTLLLAR